MAVLPQNQPNTKTGSIKRQKSRSKLVNTILLMAVAISLTMIFLIPFYIIIRNGLLPQAKLTSFDWTWLPIPPYLQSFTDLLENTNANILVGLRNSFFIAIAQCLGQLLLCSMAGYGLARIPYKYSNYIFGAILVTLMIPSAVTFIPLYVQVAYFGWVSTMQGLIVPGLFSAFNTFLFRTYFLSFPTDLEEAGMVDGMNYPGVFFRLVVPNSVPIFIALGVITFFGSWNSFLWPLVIAQNSSAWTVQIVISTFLTAQTVNLPAIFMGSTVSILPLMILFFVFQRYIVQGYTMSGIKG